MAEVLEWEPLKNLLDRIGIEPRWTEDNSKYYVFARDGRIVFKTTLAKGKSEAIEFENNYKIDYSKKDVPAIKRVLGEDIYSISPRCMNFIVAHDGGMQRFNKQLDKSLCLQGGVLYSDIAGQSDLLKVEIRDIDNILGAGADFLVDTFIPEWSIMAGKNILDDVSISSPLPPGLYMTLWITPDASLAQDRKCKLNIKSHEVQ